MVTARLRTLDQYEAANFCAERVEHCECCDTELYPDHPDFSGGKVDGMYLCFTHYLAAVESKSLETDGAA
jgi:hypothetical protein